MTTKQCQNQLAIALTEWRPSTSFEDVVHAIQENRDAVSSIPAFSRRHRPVNRWLPLVAAACVVAIIGIGSLLFWHQEGSVPPVVDHVDTLVDIDVNPGIEISVGTSDQVVAVEAVNADGRQVLEGLALQQRPLSDAVEVLFREMIEQGYIVGENNPVLVTVQNADPEEANRIHGIINDGVDTVLSERNESEKSLSISVTNQTVEAFDAVKQFAHQHGISNGKAAFILSIVEQQPTLEADALADYTFAALAAIAQHQEIPLSDLVDYDAEDGLWDLIVDDLVNEVQQAEATLGTSLLTPEKAKHLALEGLHNDWIAENALFVRVELVWKADVPMYRVEFVSLGYLYEYAISAVDGTFENPNSSTTTAGQSGTIRSTLQGGGTRTDINTPPTKTTTTTAPTTDTATITDTATTTTTTPTTGGDNISDKQAKMIAFSRLGIEEHEASGIVVSRDRHSRWGDVILVRFSYRGSVYAYHLNKSSGAVLCSFSLSEDTPVEEFNIDEWDALEIAFTQAGVQRDECREQTVMFGVDKNQTPYIDLIFAAHGYSYYYRINGKDGSIMMSNRAQLGGNHDAPPSLIVE